MAGETLLLSPLPRRAFESPGPRTPSKAETQELHTTRSFWYDNVNEEANEDLQAVLGFQTPTKLSMPDWIPAFEAGCLDAAGTTATSPPPKSSWSTASTAATSPPPPSCWSAASPPPPSRCWSAASVTSPPPPSNISLPTSPEPSFMVQSDLNDGIDSPTHAQQLQCPPGALDKSSWLQARKVFVGGIPQRIDQNGLFHMFSKIGKVKKAWLQLFRNDGLPAPATKRHRGFGFVIFYEKHSVDKLLGNAFSQFVVLGADLNLEVKRATGRTPVQEPPIESSSKPEHLSSRSPPSSSSGWQSASPVGLQTWQIQRQPLLVGVQPTTPQPCVPPFPCAQAPAVVPPFPCAQTPAVVPPFPCAQTPAVQWTFGRNPAWTANVRLTTSQSVPTSPEQTPQWQAQACGPLSQFVPPALFDAFAGQGCQEMELALREALPDCYED